MKLEKLFLHEKAVEVLLKIYEAEKNGDQAYPLGISKEVGSPYSYISKVIGIFEENALTESEFEGRIRKVKLTEDGKKIAELFLQLKQLLNMDLVTRKKLKELKKIVASCNKHKGEELLRKILPVKAELEIIESEDGEVLKMIEDLKNVVEEILDAS